MLARMHWESGLPRVALLRERFPAARSATTIEKMDNFAVLKYPLTTESAMKKIEDNNTLVSPGLNKKLGREAAA